MRTFDLTPLYRSTVGFDQMAGLMDRVLAEPNGGQTYPPYNIEKNCRRWLAHLDCRRWLQ